ncbi:hypothetical protein KY362_04595, partial [Candidatus Woesearchaeota archaeon]|nr:hypothetical protein [Candidatus Woesearchaeota archaeon]
AYLALASPAEAEEAEPEEDTVEQTVEEEATASPLEEITLSGSISYNSVYYMRGLQFSEGPVLQTLDAVNYRSLTFILFGNLDLEQEAINEVDLVFDFRRDVGRFSVNAGYALFLYPGADPGRSMEIYGGIGITSPLQFGVFVAYDFEAGDGLYVEFRAGYDIEAEPLTLSLSTAIGLNSGYWREGDGYNLEFRAALPVDIPGPLTVVPTVIYSQGLTEETDSVFQWSVALRTD